MMLHETHQTPRRPYYVYAPPWRRNSAGKKAMHLLCHHLNKIGEEAYVHLHIASEVNPLLQTPLLTGEVMARHRAMGAEPVVIYPEVLHGNPLNARYVVRYILNHPGLLGGPKTFDDSDLLVYYHPEYMSELDKTGEVPILLLPTWDYSVFNNENNEWDNKRNGHLIYPGRYDEAKDHYPELFENATIITSDWPDTHEALASLFRKSRVLYCFANSAILSEARLCGCPVVLLDSPFSQKPEGYAPDKPDYYLHDPGITRDRSEASIERARQNIAEFRQTDLCLRQNFIEQLQYFIRLSQEMKPASAITLAKHAFNRGDNDIAIERLTTALAETPENPLVYAYLAFICARQGLIQGAADFIGQATQLAPDRVDLKATLGETFLKAGRPDLAVQYLNEAITAQPDLWSAYPALANALHAIGRGGDAVLLLQHAADIPCSEQAQIQKTLFEILEKTGDSAGLNLARLKFCQT
jgi:tetratricopeptide (TPR) repeat protein